MAKKRTTKQRAKRTSAADSLAARQREDGYKVGPGCPPKECQFKPGESGNPKGNVKRRTHLWEYFTHYMGMTAAGIGKLDKTKLSLAEQAALRLAKAAAQGKRCPADRFARYSIDRDEGRPIEHLVLDEGADLSDARCEELARMLRQAWGEAQEARSGGDTNT